MADIKISALTTGTPANGWSIPASSGTATFKVPLFTGNSGNSVVFRDGSGNFSAGNISATNVTGLAGGSSTFNHNVIVNGTLTVTTLNATNFSSSGTLTSPGLNVTGNAIVNGTLYCYNDVVAYWTGSDERYKTNKQVISNALAKLDGFNGYEFVYGDKAPKHLHGKSAYGVIAQEIEKVLPHAVGNRESDGSGGNYKGVAYEQLLGVLIQAVKELKAEVATLKAKA